LCRIGLLIGTHGHTSPYRIWLNAFWERLTGDAGTRRTHYHFVIPVARSYLTPDDFIVESDGGEEIIQGIDAKGSMFQIVSLSYDTGSNTADAFFVRPDDYQCFTLCEIARSCF
jgi:hypothetical protein